MLKKTHPIAGTIGFLTILTFWISTAYSEVFGAHETIIAVKTMVLNGMIVLIPAMIIVGASGMSMGRQRKNAPALAKKKRMPVIAANGLLILLPAAFFFGSEGNSRHLR